MALTVCAAPPAVAALCLLLVAGCKKADEIERYTVAKLPSPETAVPQASGAKETKDRMLAAIVPHGKQLWFFKVTGPNAAVDGKTEAFLTFIKSLHFAEDAESPPEWTLPADWKQQPGSEFRFATIHIPAVEKPLELSVTALPKPDGVEDAFVLSNVNRWRGQMQLAPITQDQLAAETVSVPLEGTKAILVNLVGAAAPIPMGRGPFSGGGDGK